jgi:hypothetical protein
MRKSFAELRTPANGDFKVYPADLRARRTFKNDARRNASRTPERLPARVTRKPLDAKMIGTRKPGRVRLLAFKKRTRCIEIDKDDFEIGQTRQYHRS